MSDVNLWTQSLESHRRELLAEAGNSRLVQAARVRRARRAAAPVTGGC